MYNATYEKTKDLFSLVFKSHNIFSNKESMLIKENYKYDKHFLLTFLVVSFLEEEIKNHHESTHNFF
jgi:hypothetical protein